MSTTLLKSEVQTRLDAISYSSGTSQAVEVLQLAVDAVGLGLNLDNIVSVHTSMTSAIGSGTSDDDLTALNAGSIALGITSRGGAATKRTLPIAEMSAGTLLAKTAASSYYNSTSSNFFTQTCNVVFGGYEGDFYTSRVSTTYRTLIDLPSAEGILTSIVTPTTAINDATYTIEITIDGVITEINYTVGLQGNRAVLGGWESWGPTANADQVGIGSVKDFGFNSAAQFMLLTPLQAIRKGDGIPFKESLRVRMIADSTAASQAGADVSTSAVYYAKQPNVEF